jgi:hypothetical protein
MACTTAAVKLIAVSPSTIERASSLEFPLSLMYATLRPSTSIPIGKGDIQKVRSRKLAGAARATASCSSRREKLLEFR